MKKLQALLLSTLLLFSATAFVSCSDDDDKDQEPVSAAHALLIGGWSRSSGVFSESYIFEADGSMAYYWEEGSYSGRSYGSYSYDDATRRLTTIEDGDTYSYTVATLTETTLILIDSYDGASYVYSRDYK